MNYGRIIKNSLAIHEVNNPYFHFIQVTVTITDINDNPPVIQQMSPVSVTVQEHSPVGTLVAIITAVDILDFGDNTHVVYEIISGNEDCE